MATLALPALVLPTRIGDRVLRLSRANPPLALGSVIMLVVLLATLVGLLIDPRQVINEPVWLKPAKFAISIVIYSFTLIWLMSFIERHRRLVLAVSWIVFVVLLIEEAINAFQAMRGVRSHFNEETLLDALLWSTMGGAIMVLWLANLVAVVVLLRQRFTNPVLAWGVRFGLIIALFGMAVAFLMPTDITGGAHSVGVADGGPGLPFVGWSTVGGDLRVPHFVGLHALQAMPVVAWLLTLLPATWLSTRDRARLMTVAGIGGLGLVALLTWQALRGQSLVAPDQLTLTVLCSGIAVLGLAATAILNSARSRTGGMTT